MVENTSEDIETEFFKDTGLTEPDPVLSCSLSVRCAGDSWILSVNLSRVLDDTLCINFKNWFERNSLETVFSKVINYSENDGVSLYIAVVKRK